MIYDRVTTDNITKISIRAAFNESVIPEAPKYAGRLIVQTLKDFNKKIASLEGNHKEQQKFYKLKKEFIELTERAEDIDNFDLAPVYVESTLSQRQNKRGHGKHYKEASREYAKKIRWQFIKFAYKNNKDYLEDLGLSRHILKLMKAGFVNSDLLPISIDHKIELALAGKYVKQKSYDIDNIYSDKATYEINHFNNLILLPNKVHNFKNKLRRIQSKLYNINEPRFLLTLVPDSGEYDSEFINLDQTNDDEFGIEIKSDVEVVADFIKTLSNEGKQSVLASKSRNMLMECIIEELQTQTEYVSGPYKTIDDVKALHRLYKMPELRALHKKIQGRRNPNVQRLNKVMLEAAELVRTESPFEVVTKERTISAPKAKKARKDPSERVRKIKDDSLKEAKIINDFERKLSKKLSQTNKDQTVYANQLAATKDIIKTGEIAKRVAQLKNSNSPEAIELRAAIENANNLFTEEASFLKRGKITQTSIDRHIKYFKALHSNIAADKEPKTASYTKKINKELIIAASIKVNNQKAVNTLLSMYKSVKSNSNYIEADKNNLSGLNRTLANIENFLLANGVKEEQLVIVPKVKPVAHIKAAENKKTNKVASREKLSRKAKKQKQKEAALAKSQEASTAKTNSRTETVSHTTAPKKKYHKKLNIEDAIIVKTHKLEQERSAEAVEELHQLCLRAKESFLAPQMKKNKKSYAVEAAIKEANTILEAEGLMVAVKNAVKPQEKKTVFKYKKKEKDPNDKPVRRKVSAPTTTGKTRSKAADKLRETEAELYNAIAEAKNGSLEEYQELSYLYSDIINSQDFKKLETSNDKKGSALKSLVYKTEKVLLDNGFVIPTERLTQRQALLDKFNAPGKYNGTHTGTEITTLQKHDAVETPKPTLNTLDKKAKSLIEEAGEIIEVLSNGKSRNTEKEVFELNEVFNEIGTNITHVRHYQKTSDTPEAIDNTINEGKKILENWGFVSLDF